jgi:hypothetical protein
MVDFIQFYHMLGQQKSPYPVDKGFFKIQQKHLKVFDLTRTTP